MPMPMSARSKVWACDLSLAGIEGSNPTGCCRVDPSSRGVLPSVMCLNVREASIKGSPGTLGNVVQLKGRDETTGYELIKKKVKFNLLLSSYSICDLFSS